jgi:hypothetical protein
LVTAPNIEIEKITVNLTAEEREGERRWCPEYACHTNPKKGEHLKGL